MQDMRAWLSSLGVFKHTASLASSMRCSEGCASSCFSSMGSSTKWLGHLSCLLSVDRAGIRHSEREKKDILSGKLAEGRYVHTRRALIDIEQLFWSYWKDRGVRSIMV